MFQCFNDKLLHITLKWLLQKGFMYLIFWGFFCLKIDKFTGKIKYRGKVTFNSGSQVWFALVNVVDSGIRWILFHCHKQTWGFKFVDTSCSYCV